MKREMKVGRTGTLPFQDLAKRELRQCTQHHLVASYGHLSAAANYEGQPIGQPILLVPFPQLLWFLHLWNTNFCLYFWPCNFCYWFTVALDKQAKNQISSPKETQLNPRFFNNLMTEESLILTYLAKTPLLPNNSKPLGFLTSSFKKNSQIRNMFWACHSKGLMFACGRGLGLRGTG